ncbi:hypothetical protein DFH09DRAFT_1082818 [Mycena vulgaris]|nr:hypothetical protein DFH09DRAFT_1082818 [Mycena vulgaris]
MFPESRRTPRTKFKASGLRVRQFLGRTRVFFSGHRTIAPVLPDIADALSPVPGPSSPINRASSMPFKLFPQDHDTHYLTSECAVNDSLRPIVDGVVGFDTEFVERRPTADETIINEVIDLVGGSRKSAVLAWQVLEARRSNNFPFAWDTMGLCIVQIARGRDVWIIDVRRMKDIIKVGVGVVNDIPVIWNDLRIDVNNLVDAGMMARLLLAEKYANGAYQNLSMDIAAQEILGFSVDKKEQVSDWTADLSDAQLRFVTDAGTDAIVALRLYEALQPQLRVRASQLGRDIPDAWYNFNSRMGEPTRVKRTVHGVVVPWSEKSWKGLVVHPGMIHLILFAPSLGFWQLGSITHTGSIKSFKITGECIRPHLLQLLRLRRYLFLRSTTNDVIILINDSRFGHECGARTAWSWSRHLLFYLPLWSFVMNIHEQDYMHVFTHVLVGHLVCSFHVRVISRYDDPLDFAFFPKHTGTPTILIRPGHGCCFVVQHAGRDVHALLVPPMSDRDAHRAFQSSDIYVGTRLWPEVTHFDQDVYQLRPGEVLCNAYLSGQNSRFEPEIYEYSVCSLLSPGSVSRGTRLVCPSAWLAQAEVVDWVYHGYYFICLECILPTGRVIWVKMPNEQVEISVGIRGRLGRLTLTALLAQEKLLLDSRDLPPTSSDPFRSLARRLVRERHEYKERRRAERYHAQVRLDRGPSRNRSPLSSGSSRSSSPLTQTASPTPSPPPPSSRRFFVNAAPRIQDPFGRRGLSGLRHDYMGHLIVKVATADFVEGNDGSTVHRHAVLDPGIAGVFQADMTVLLIGMVHKLVRVDKNHGCSTQRPFCSVIECEALTGGVSSVVILLVANHLVHPTFIVAPDRSVFYLGAGAGDRVVNYHHLENIPKAETSSDVRAVSASVNMSQMIIAHALVVLTYLSHFLYMFPTLLAVHRVITFALSAESDAPNAGNVVSFAVPHSAIIDFSFESRNPLFEWVLVHATVDGRTVYKWLPNMVPRGSCYFTSLSLQPPRTRQSALALVRHSGRDAPLPVWSLQYDAVVVAEVVEGHLPEGAVVGASTEISPDKSLPALGDFRKFDVFSVFSTCPIRIHTIVILPFSFLGHVQALKLLDVGLQYCFIQCVVLDTLETVTIRVEVSNVDVESFTLRARVKVLALTFSFVVWRVLRAWFVGRGSWGAGPKTICFDDVM